VANEEKRGEKMADSRGKKTKRLFSVANEEKRGEKMADSRGKKKRKGLIKSGSEYLEVRRTSSCTDDCSSLS
jgi:hypothetical protein